MLATQTCTKKSVPFLQSGLTRNKNDLEIQKEADKLWLPFYLILNGVPENMVSMATTDQLRVLEELVTRKKTSEKYVSDTGVIQVGVARAFGGGQS